MKRFVYLNCVLTLVLVALLWYCLERNPGINTFETDPGTLQRVAPTDGEFARRNDIHEDPPAVSAFSPYDRTPETEDSGASAAARDYMAHAVIAVRYGYILREFDNLPPNSRNELLRLLYERDRALKEFAKTEMAPRGEHPLSEEIVVAEQRLQAADNAIVALTGDRGAEALKLLKLSGSMTMIRNAISPHMEFAGVPLSAQQERALAEQMYPLDFDSDSPVFRGMLVGDVQRLSLANAELRSAATSFLSPEQLDVLASCQRELELRSLERSARSQR